MPCTDGGGWDRGDPPADTQLLDKVTRIACTALGLIEARGLLKELDKECLDWWTAHKKADELRLKVEAKNAYLLKVRVATLKLQEAISLGENIAQARSALDSILDEGF
jgi:hypothetical protein